MSGKIGISNNFFRNKPKKIVKEISNTKLLKGGDFEYLIGDSGKAWGAALRCHENSTVPMIIRSV